MTIGAVVVAYHTTPKQLNSCLQGLQRNKIDQIVVVDNEENKKLAPLVQSYGGQYFSQSDNLGFAHASHLGALKLPTDLIFFINPDAIILPDAIRQSIIYLNHHPLTAILGLRLESGFGIVERSYGSKVTPLSIFTRKIHFLPIPTHPARAGWVSGGAMIIRREAYFACGGFDSRFFMYWEDIDICRRISRLGWRVIYFPLGRVRHQRGASLTDFTIKTRLYDESADKYWRKHYPKWVCFLQLLMRSLYRRFSSLVD